MEDISLHILDIAENAVRADARTIEINITRDAEQNLLRIEVNDDGRGMDAETLAKVRDPFFTTKRKKTGTRDTVPVPGSGAGWRAGQCRFRSGQGHTGHSNVQMEPCGPAAGRKHGGNGPDTHCRPFGQGVYI